MVYFDRGGPRRLIDSGKKQRGGARAFLSQVGFRDLNDQSRTFLFMTLSTTPSTSLEIHYPSMSCKPVIIEDVAI